MFGKSWKLAVVIALVSIFVFGTGSAFAAGGSGPDDALAPEGAWKQINPGEEAWYAFRYDGEEGELLVKMDLEPNDGAMFYLYTPEDAQLWREQGKKEPVGAGSVDNVVGADLASSSEFNEAGTYYVVVEHAGGRTSPTYYCLGVSGEGVYVPKAAPARAIVAAAPAAPAKAAGEGFGPENAMEATGEWMELPDGKSHWYAFRYDGEEGSVHVKMNAAPEKDIKFTVRTPEDVRIWRDSGEVEACGCGTENTVEKADYFWSGDFPVSGLYYVVVEDGGADSSASHYALEIMGDGVWF